MKFLILLVLISTSAYAGGTWKLPELARASNALLVEMDSISAGKKSTCGLTTMQVSQASQNLQSRIDDRIGKLKNQENQIRSFVKSCESDCTCDIYQYALEKLVPDENKVKEFRKISSEQRKNCFQRLNNFCSSKLFQSLLKK